MKIDERIISILEKNPGLSGYQLHQELIKESWFAKRFGENSFIAVLFGASFGKMYVALLKLEQSKKLTSVWGVATSQRGGHRPRHYYVCK